MGWSFIRPGSRAVYLAALAMLVSCGGGGGDGSQSEQVVSASGCGPSVGLPVSSGYQEGEGGDGEGGVAGGGIGAGGSLGAFVGVTISVFCGDGTVLGSAPVGSDSMVTIRTAPDYAGPLQLSIVGSLSSTYYDEAKDALIKTGEGVLLRAVVPKADQPIGITPLTESAVRYLETQAANGVVRANEPSAIEAANTRVRDEINRFLPAADQIQDITVLPALVTDVSQIKKLPAGPQAVYARVLAAFADTAAETNSSLSRPAFSFAAQLAADLTDGVIDDRAADGSPTSTENTRAFSAATLADTLAKSLERVIAEITGVLLPKVSECLASFRLGNVNYSLLGITRVNNDEAACRYDSPLGPVNLILIRYSGYSATEISRYCGAPGVSQAVQERQTLLGPVYRIWSTKRQLSVSHGLPQDRLINTEVLKLAALAGVGKRCP